MNVHKHFINILRAPPSFYSTLFCIPRNISTFGKTGRYKSAVERCLSKIGWKMKACKNFILSTSHIRRNRVPCLQRTTLLQRRRTGLGPWLRPSGAKSKGPSDWRTLLFPKGEAPAQPVQGRASAWPLWCPFGTQAPGPKPSSCLHSSAIGLADSGGRSGRHTFKKFYFKKTIIDNISRQKKHTFSINQGYKMIILRPLLQFSRFEFLKFCEFWYLPIIPDFTNFNVCFRRNNLRLQFIPYLKIFLNLNLFQKIDQFQQILKLENQYLQFILKKIHGGTFYGETAGQALGPFDFAPEASPAKLGSHLTSPQRGPAAWLAADKGGPFASGSTLWGEGQRLALGPSLPPHVTNATTRDVKPMDRPPKGGAPPPARLAAPLRLRSALGLPPASVTPSKCSAQIYRPSLGPLGKHPWGEQKPDGWKARPPAGLAARRSIGIPNRQAFSLSGFRPKCQSLGIALGGRGTRTRHKAKPSCSGANAVSNKFSLFPTPDCRGFGAHASPKSRCFLHNYRKNYFFYFPKIFQYLIIHNFYYLVSKKISFNEISCIFQKLKPQSKSK